MNSSLVNGINFEEHMKERIRLAVIACTPPDKNVHVHCTLVVKVDNENVQTLCISEGITEQERLKASQLPTSNLLYSNLNNFLSSLLTNGNESKLNTLVAGMGLHLPTVNLSSILPHSTNTTMTSGFSTFLSGAAANQQTQPQILSHQATSALNNLSPFSMPFNTATGLFNSDLLNCVMANTMNGMQSSANTDKSSTATFTPAATSSASNASANSSFNNLTSALLALNNNSTNNLLNQFPLNFSLSYSNNGNTSQGSNPNAGISASSMSSLPSAAVTTNTNSLVNGMHVANDASWKPPSRNVSEERNETLMKSLPVSKPESCPPSDAYAARTLTVDHSRDVITDNGISSSKRRKLNKPTRLPHETDTAEDEVQQSIATHSRMFVKIETEELSSEAATVVNGTTAVSSSMAMDGSAAPPSTQLANSSVDEVLRRFASSSNYLQQSTNATKKRKIMSIKSLPNNLLGNVSMSDISSEFLSSNGALNTPPLAIPTKKISSSKTFRCNQCKQMFPSLNSLCEHTFEVHGSFRCTVCDSKFTQRSNLQRHALKHVGFKPFECIVCKRAYYRKDHSIRHVEVTHPTCDPKSSIQCHLTSSQCLEYLEDMEKSGLLVSVKKSKTSQVLNDAGSSPSSNLEKNGGDEDYEELDDEDEYDEIDGLEDEVKLLQGDGENVALSLVMRPEKGNASNSFANLAPAAHSSLEESDFPSTEESMNLPSLVVDEGVANNC